MLTIAHPSDRLQGSGPAVTEAFAAIGWEAPGGLRLNPQRGAESGRRGMVFLSILGQFFIGLGVLLVGLAALWFVAVYSDKQ